MSEQREILRRIAERGLRLAQESTDRLLAPAGTIATPAEQAHLRHLDLWQHMLDEIQRLPSSGDSNGSP